MENQTLENLIKRISQPAIFFYPRYIFEELSGKDLKELDAIGMAIKNSKYLKKSSFIIQIEVFRK